MDVFPDKLFRPFRPEQSGTKCGIFYDMFRSGFWNEPEYSSRFDWNGTEFKTLINMTLKKKKKQKTKTNKHQYNNLGDVLVKIRNQKMVLTFLSFCHFFCFLMPLLCFYSSPYAWFFSKNLFFFPFLIVFSTDI